ncbi:MAG: hypothetical protein ACI80S_001075 [Pseudohongiellaceae bacterium]|jgi:hypothetical protein
MSSSVDPEDKEIIGRVYEGNLSVIPKFVDELPESDYQAQFTQYLSYRGSMIRDDTVSNRMPLEARNQRVINLEHTIEDGIKSMQQVYSAPVLRPCLDKFILPVY